MRHRTTLAVFLAAGAILSGCCGSALLQEDPLKLISISLDTMRADRLSSYGHELPTTPHLDELAETSVVFSDCIAQSTATAASHMRMFTGQYVHRHGLADTTRVLFPRATLASALRDHGRRTAAFTGHGSLQAKLGHEVGFDLFQSASTGAGPTHPSRNLPEVVPEALQWLDAEPREPLSTV